MNAIARAFLGRPQALGRERDQRRGLAPDRTTLWWLIAATGLVILPHLGRIPIWYLPLFGLAVAERMSHEYVRRPVIPAWLRLAVTLAASAAITLQYGMLLGRRAGVALLCVMIALKLTETYRRRDVYVLISLAYFVAVTQFLFSQSIYLLAYILLVVVLITGTLVVSELQPSRLAGRRLDSAGLWQTLRSVLLLTAQSVPLMIALFFLFPRLESPLWGRSDEVLEGVTGIDDEMSPGSLTELSIDDSPALRATFEGPLPAPNQRYWRGPVLWTFDGRTWRRPTVPLGDLATIDRERIGEPLRYRITLEPTERRWLFTLDVPTAVPPDAKLTFDHTVLRPKPIVDLLAYEAASDPAYVIDPVLPEALRRAALSLPAGFNPRARELAERWRDELGADPVALIQRALALFREEFSYSYQPPPLGRDTADDFLFETREGFCEHFASAFTILMRAAGVPTRVVLGFQGGAATGDYLLVRNADAHAWTEVWIAGRGWVRVDPTAAVSPERVSLGARAALGRRGMLDTDWLRNLRTRLDVVHHWWNEWVLRFDDKRQLALFERVGLAEMQTTATAIALAVVTGLLMALVTYIVMQRAWLGGLDPAGRQFARFCRKLARGGVRRAPSEGPRDLARRAMRQFPGQARAIRAITERYIALRYGAQADPDELSVLRGAVRAFPRRPRGAAGPRPVPT